MSKRRFVWDAGDLTISQCSVCVHKHAGTATCDAFKKKIPDAILVNQHDHRNPYEGDGGVLFERVPDD